MIYKLDKGRLSVELIKVREGKTQLLVPKHEKKIGPKSSQAEIFYNPSMELNRDICISFLKTICEGDEILLDGMAASGARGVRIGKEVGCKKVVVNDVDKGSFELIKKNIELNNLNNVKPNKEAIEIHLLENRYKYDYVDIDPFGTPVPYYSPAVKSVSNRGVIAVTSTDTAPLCGTYTKVCQRRYSSTPVNNWCCHEIGLRILVGFCVREAARYDKSATPLLSYYNGHHFRTYLKIREGAKRGNRAIDNLDTFYFDDLGWYEEEDKCGEKWRKAGPLWSGDLFSKKILKRMEPLGKLDEDMISLWLSECEMPPFFYDSNTIGSYFKIAPPSMEVLEDEIQDRGFKTSRTHFKPTGLKSDIGVEDIKEFF
ncbi:MAG: tRNA (guanine(26)-N(2))-dimethyltransferase [Candidatus Saliniplasma sp.]